MKKDYQNPQIEVTIFDIADVITLSIGNLDIENGISWDNLT